MEFDENNHQTEREALPGSVGSKERGFLDCLSIWGVEFEDLGYVGLCGLVVWVLRDGVGFLGVQGV